MLGMGVARVFFVLMAVVWISVVFVSWVFGIVAGFVVSCMFLVVVLWFVLTNFDVFVFSVIGVVVSDGFWAEAINVQNLFWA